VEKPVLMKFSPSKIDEGMDRPEFRALVDNGWTVATTMVLEDERVPEDSPQRQRLALLLMPPRPGLVLPRWVLPVAVVQSVALVAVVVLLSMLAVTGGA